MWHQDNLHYWLMIDFIVISWELQLYILDTRVKRGVELSVSWIRWWGKMPVKSCRPKHVVRVTLGTLSQTGPSSAAPLLKRLTGALAVRLLCLPWLNSQTRWCTPRERKVVRLKESYQAWLACWTLEALDSPNGLQPLQSLRQKLGCWRSTVRPWKTTCSRLHKFSGKPSDGLGKQCSTNIVILNMTCCWTVEKLL